MGNNKKTITVVSITTVFALGLGFAIGTTIKGGKGAVNANNNAVFVPDASLSDKTPEELTSKLSEVMLPEEEFGKLEAAIFQTAMGLFMAQAQQAGLNVTDSAQQELKKSISDKYSRKYFSDMNANSMKDLNKEELIAVISFYNTESGQKFLKMSPKIIQTTMQAVQADLSSWLPTTVDTLVAKLKGGNEKDKNEPSKEDLKEAPKNSEAKS